MEGLIFFIAMIIFIVRVMNKIKKATSGGDKKKSAGAKSPPLRDKLEELIKSMEEAERLKKEGQHAEDADRDFKSAFMPDGEYETAYREEAEEAAYPDAEEVHQYSYADARGYKGKEFLKTVYSRESFVKYDVKDDTPEKDYRKEDREDIPDDWIDKKKKSEKYSRGQEKKTAGKKDIRSLSGLKTASVSGGRRKKGGILDTLSRYPDIQKAVVLKEILDKPVSEKI